MPMLALVLAASVASPVAVTKQKSPDGGHVMAHEVVVAAPPDDVWHAISTADGWSSWAVPTAWAPAPDIIETSYTPTAKPDEPSTIKQQVLFRAPGRLMLFRTIKAPEGFPDFDTFSKVTNLFEVEDAGGGRTRVRLTGTGYADTPAGQRLLAAFEQGNKVSLEKLAARFGGPAMAGSPKLSAQLSALSHLVGHCWRGEFKGRGQVDTHCYESVYGGKHIRDRHEVTGGKEVYRGETIYSWNSELKRVEFTYWNSLGGVSRGTMVPKDGVLDFGDETYTGSDGSKMVISTLWRRAGDNAYEAVSRGHGVTGERVVTYTRVD